MMPTLGPYDRRLQAYNNYSPLQMLCVHFFCPREPYCYNRISVHRFMQKELPMW